MLTRQEGFTLVELMVTIVVAAILLTLAIPSFNDMVDRRRLVGAADNVLADMRFAQAEAMKSNAQVKVTFTVGANWSYTMDTSPSRTNSGTAYKGTSLAVSAAVTSASGAITFDPKRNTIQPTPTANSQMVVITSALGKKLSLEVTPESAMRLCTTTSVPGFPACS